MKFAIVILAVVAAASAQFNPFQPQYTGQYNPFARKPTYNSFPSTPAPYRPFVSSTPAPVVYNPTFATPTFATPTALPPARVSPVVPRVNQADASANIVRYDNDVNPDGSYSYVYETDNGIAAQEQGVPKSLGGNPPVAPVVAQGSYSYTSPEGKTVVITYIADENGFQPSGEAIPTPHPIPQHILRSLEYNARFAPSQ